MTLETISTAKSIDTMPYAMDVQVTHKGRRFAKTKRRIKFTFGFGNLQALQHGKSSHECRGQEHEVVVLWSLTSGKQRVLADGIEVHFSKQANTTKGLDCKWTMPSGHQMSVSTSWFPLGMLSTSTSSSNSNNHSNKENAKKQHAFDLTIDGVSFWDMPKIFQLGGASTTTTSSSSGSSRSSTRHATTAAAAVKPLRRRSAAAVVPASATNSNSDSNSKPTIVTRAMSSPFPENSFDSVLSPSASQTSLAGWEDLLSPPQQQQQHQSLYFMADASASTSASTRMAQKPTAMRPSPSFSRLDNSWHVPSRSSSPNQESSHSMHERSSFGVGVSSQSLHERSSFSSNLTTRAPASYYHYSMEEKKEDEESPMERALKSLVDLNPTTNMSRCNSVSDLSVQSEYNARHSRLGGSTSGASLSDLYYSSHDTRHLQLGGAPPPPFGSSGLNESFHSTNSLQSYASNHSNNYNYNNHNHNSYNPYYGQQAVSTFAG